MKTKTVLLRGVEIGAGRPKIIVPIVGKTEQEILDKAAESVAAAVCLRLHDLAVNAGDRRLAERPLGFAGAGVETGA